MEALDGHSPPNVTEHRPRKWKGTVVADPNDIHTREDLRRALGELYTSADISYNDLAGRSGVSATQSTIHAWVNGDSFPQWANLFPVLRVWGITADELDAWKDAHKRADADARIRPGLPLDEVRDAFVLEVHEPITVTDATMKSLPPYMRRTHDDRLAEVVERALAGSSGIAVLLGDSSTGKTRALWEALEPLRARRGWRLWHPSPYHPETLREQLDKVGPRTVLWLNETQRYFLPADELDRGRLAEQLQTMLASRRAPILVLGSLWHAHYDTLCTDPGSATRKLLEPAAITVPEEFTGADLVAMRAFAGEDPRLEMAVERAESGKVTQYLAGGPELVHFYDKHASVPGRAVIEAAMDAVRLGHPNVLPFTLLRDAAASYIDDITWDSLDDNWFEAALYEVSRKCKGARGPVTPIKERPSAAHTRRRRAGRASVDSGQPVYQLADYLEQYGRRVRARSTPPLGFWETATEHAAPDHQDILANAAWDRGLYREAAQLWKNATRRGHVKAAVALITELTDVFPDDAHDAVSVVAHILLDDPRAVAWLIEQLRKLGAHTQVDALVGRDPAAHVDLDDLGGVSMLIKQLREVGAHAQVRVLADRAAAQCPLDDPGFMTMLLGWLWEVGAHTQMQTLVDRGPAAHVDLDDLGGVNVLIKQLREVGAHAQVRVLADRAAAHVPLDDPGEVAVLLGWLWEVGAHTQMQTLVDRGPAAHVDLYDPDEVALLIEQLREVGAHTQVQALVDRDPAAHIDRGSPAEVSLLVEQLREVGAHAQVQALADRAAALVHLGDPRSVAVEIDNLLEVGEHALIQALVDRNPAACVDLDDLFGVGWLIEQFQEIGAPAQVQVLADRAAAHVLLDDPLGVAWLIGRLWEVGAHTQVQALVERDPAAQVDIGGRIPTGVAELIGELCGVGAHAQVQALADRAAQHVLLNDPSRVARLIGQLREVGAHTEVQALVERDPAAQVDLDQPLPGILLLIGQLRELGAHTQIQVLAERLPAAGGFALFLKTRPDLEQKFRFGRAPADELTPAEPWSWIDLE
ncbi:AAA family ATPase [Nocardia salmonicida]|uniref:AAA family ATPase n=1 Tax=Nocardia salmonicida TaxID=53431 RepID=UPI00372282AA